LTKAYEVDDYEWRKDVDTSETKDLSYLFHGRAKNLMLEMTLPPSKYYFSQPEITNKVATVVVTMEGATVNKKQKTK